MSERPVLQGLGSIFYEGGVAFRVWAPHASMVSVIGTFNNWDPVLHPLRSEAGGYWYIRVDGAHIGDQCKYQLTTENGIINRIDPHAREVTNSVGNAIVHDPIFDWEDEEYLMFEWDQLFIYKL